MMPNPTKQPWSRAEATRNIQVLARSPELRLAYTDHAKMRMADRDMVIGDVLWVLKEGFVHRDPEPSTQPGLFKYHPENRSPNSGNRMVRVVVIPDPAKSWMKIVTVMWVDET